MKKSTTEKNGENGYTMCDLGLPLKSQIQGMRPGMSMAFPLEKLTSVRSIASNVGLEAGLKFVTRSKREERLVIVSCVEEGRRDGYAIDDKSASETYC